MRSTVARALWADAQLNALGVVRASLLSGDVDTPAQRPYAALRWGETVPGVADSRQKLLTVWVHDRPNDYTRIDAIIRRVRTILTDMHTPLITAIDWVTDSGDLSDDQSKTILRTTSYNVVASGQ